MSENDTRPFPVQGGVDASIRPVRYFKPSQIPLWLAEAVYRGYSKRSGSYQSMADLERRGGFSCEEVMEYLKDG